MLLRSSPGAWTGYSRRWLTALAGGLLSLAVLAGGLGLRAAAAEDDKSDKAAKKPTESPGAGKTDPREDQLGRALRDLDEMMRQLGAGLDDEGAKQRRQQLQEAQKHLERLRDQMRQGRMVPGFPGGAWAVPGGFPFDPFGNGEPRLGVQLQRPSATLVEQLDLPRQQGLVLEAVSPGSAAAKAGLRRHDILLELGGKAVPSQLDRFAKLLAEIKPNTAVDAVVMRKGKKETVKGVTLPEARAGLPGLPGFPGGGFRGRLFDPGVFGRGDGTVVSRVGNEFTTTHRAGNLKITIKGTVSEGKANVREVAIEDASGQKGTYDSLDKVPAEYKEKVQKLVEASVRTGVKKAEDF